MDCEISETSHLLDAGAVQRKQPTPLPKLQIAILMLLQLAEPLTSHCIYPFINQLIIDFDIAGGDGKKVGYYAGLIESIFFATEALFVFQWARLSDHIGRKPVLLVGVGGLCLSMICFGLSRTLLTLVLSRSLVGLLNGNAGVMKTMIGEITDSTNIAQAFGWVPVSWGIGTTIAPMMGGQLARPHGRWPHVFSHPFWTKYPYFLPCAVSAAFSAGTFLITALFLKESILKRHLEEHSDSSEPRAEGRPEDDAPLPPLRAILTRPIVIAIANYGVLALTDIALMSLIPLFLTMPISLGGLGLEPSTIGIILGVQGVFNGVFQALLFARVVDAWGAKRVFQFGLLMFIPSFLMFPLMSLHAKVWGLTPMLWTILVTQQFMIVLMNFGYGTVFILITSSVSHNRSLGAVNGVAQFIASIARMVGPAASTSLFSTSLEREWLGGYAVYVILICMSVAFFFTSTLLPREIELTNDRRRSRED